MRVTIDLSGLERHYKTLQAETMQNIDAGMSDLTGEARELAVDIVNAQIYDTPERGYDRTGALRDSIYTAKDRPKRTKWRLLVGARGGAGGREYALYNERGTYSGRVSLQSIRRRAEAMQGLILLQYGDPAKGLEPRPWTIPTLVMVARFLPKLVADAVRDAEHAATR